MHYSETIRQANPLAQYHSHQPEINAAVARVLESGSYILGAEVERFEGEWAAYIGVGHAIGVASGTDALEIALRACDIGAGDEVITTTHTAVATVAAIELAGARPVLVDIEPGTWLMDHEQIERKITARTKAIVVVHLYGQPADLDRITEVARRHRLRLIEDCAQAHGATFRGRRTGAWGDFGCFSFYPTKNLGAVGDGGAAVTDNAALAERARQLREYGWQSRYISRTTGLNSRLDEIQAAILRAKLPTLDEDNARRLAIATQYSRELAEYVSVPVVKPERTSVFHLYVVATPHRKQLTEFLGERRIGTAVHYPVPIHLQPAYAGRLGNQGDFPVAECASARLLSLPIYPELAPPEVSRVIESIRLYFEKNSKRTRVPTLATDAVRCSQKSDQCGSKGTGQNE
jgi:dTDP-4-amino-4,6-dideoxygalactose transaminase